MSFDPLGGAGAPSSRSTPGEIDYRLARRQVVGQFRRGRLGRHEVCDAHPELVRAARNVGAATDEVCPICEDATVVHVSYVFGPGLSAQGRCVTTRAELDRLRGRDELACYVVEVCPACSWNHLARTFVVAPARRRSASR
ncbi:MAG: DUF5318 family protein [Acidimicrobiia bacterium]